MLLFHLLYAGLKVGILYLRSSLTALSPKVLLMTQRILNINQFFSCHILPSFLNSLYEKAVFVYGNIFPKQHKIIQEKKW